MSWSRTLGLLSATLVLAADAAAQTPPVRATAPIDPPVTVTNPGPTGFDPNRPTTGQFFNAGVPLTGYIPGGTGYAPGNTINFSGPRGTAMPFNYGGFYAGFGLPYSPYGLSAYAPQYYGAYYAPYYMPFTTPIPADDTPPPPIAGAGFGSISNLKLAGMPAGLSLQFPADARVWLNGKQVDKKAATVDLESPALTPGQQYTFDVKAEWTKDGRAYEYTNTVKVPAGERSKVTVITGTPKK